MALGFTVYQIMESDQLMLLHTRTLGQKQVSRAWISNYIPQYSVGCNYICMS